MFGAEEGQEASTRYDVYADQGNMLAQSFLFRSVVVLRGLTYSLQTILLQDM